MQSTLSDEWSIIYRRRGAIERIFSRLKEELALRWLRLGSSGGL
ncbi:MAG: hypothetical protein QXH24_07480 [Candidatus Bathyarchaeia archaeon]